MTELEAVNTLLSVIGEAPIDKLSDTTVNEITDASLARRTLTEVRRDVQAEGWSWNTQFGVKLTPNSDNKFDLTSNTLAITFYPDAYPARQYVQRGMLVYDRMKRKFDFGDEVEEITISEQVLNLDWDELPHQAQQYITIRSARLYADRYVNSNAIFVYTSGDEEYARAMLIRSEERHQDSNLLWGNDLGIDQGGGYFPVAGLKHRRI